MSSASDRSQSRDRDRQRQRQRSRSKGRVEKHKMFVTNLDGTAKEEQLQTELEELFKKYGKLKQLEVKRSKNGEYSFAFVEYQTGQDAEQAIKNLNNFIIKGKPMKVEFQDDSKRRKDPKVGCYTCGKKGHFARECRSRNSKFCLKKDNDYRRRSRSRSRSRSSSDERDRRRRRRSQSSSNQKQKRRSRNKKDKDRKHSKDDKKKKKHKKHKHRSSSDSDS